MKFLLSVAGVSFALILVVASAFMNFQYVSSWGTSDLNSQIFGAVSVALDGVKALLPFFLLWAFQNKKYLHVVIGSLLFPLLIAFSLLSALGFVAGNRSQIVTGKQDITIALNETRSALKRQHTKLEQQPTARGADVVKQALNALRQNKRFSSSKQCNDATAKKSRIFCARYFHTKTELAAAKTRVIIETKITKLEAKKSDLLAKGATRKADPQAGFLSKMTGLKIEDTQTAVNVFLAILLEAVAAFGLFLATSHGEILKQKQISQKNRKKALNDNKPQKAKKTALARPVQATQNTNIEPVITLKITSQPEIKVKSEPKTRPQIKIAML